LALKKKKKNKKKKVAGASGESNLGTVAVAGGVTLAPSLRPPRQCLEFLGHAFEGGFYYIDIGGVPMTVPEHLGVVTVAEQEPPLSIVVTAELLRNEFAQMMPGHEWSVRELSSSEFAVAFPSVEILRFCACSSTLTLPINKL
jgi:hypothetical protein